MSVWAFSKRAPGSRLGVIAAAGVLSTAVLACGSSGLKYTVPDGKVADLQGESAERIRQAREEVTKVQAELDAGKTLKDENDGKVAQAEAGREKAAGKVEATQEEIAAAKEALDERKQAANDEMEEAIARAKRERDAEIANAQQQYDALRGKLDVKLADAEREKAVALAREDLEKAIVAEKKARRASADKALWVAKARYELVKFRELGRARGDLGPDYQDDLRDFQEQVAEYEVGYSDEAKRLANLTKKREEAAKKLDKLTAPAPQK